MRDVRQEGQFPRESSSTYTAPVMQYTSLGQHSTAGDCVNVVCSSSSKGPCQCHIWQLINVEDYFSVILATHLRDHVSVILATHLRDHVSALSEALCKCCEDMLTALLWSSSLLNSLL